MKLTADLQELYYKRPENDELEFEVEQDVFKKTADLEKIGSEVDQNCWYKVKAVRSNIDDNGKRTYSPVEGYIKSDDSNVSSVSAYDWEAFGFEMLDSQADVFVFNNSTEGIKESSAAEFLKAVWKHIDLNGDGELSRPELANALKDSLAQQRLSRLVCYHQSEWGVDYEALKSEVEVLLDEGINKEQDEEKKQKLTEKKDKTLASLETKVKSFNFWDKVKEPGAAVAPAAPPPPPPGQTSLSARIANMDSPILTNLYPAMQQAVSTSESTAITYEPAYVPMPKHPRFWHFHPMAFVEQMKRVELKLAFPLKTIPLNHPRGFKNDAYKEYDYTNSAKRAAPFGKVRSASRLHAGCDLYGTPGDSIYAIDDGVVISKSFYYNDTWQITIKHNFEIKSGNKVVVVYGEVNKDNLLVNVGDEVVKGQKIAEMGLLVPFVFQPSGEKRGMLHLEMYTGEASGDIKQDVDYKDMMYSDSDDEKYTCKSDFQVSHMYKRRKDLINPIFYLNEILKMNF